MATAGRPTIKDVARRARVSVATVSNALNNPSLVADETLRRVTHAIVELGYVRNHPARQLRSGDSTTVGLIAPHLDTFFADVARGVEDVAIRNGCVVVVCNSGAQLDRQEVYLRLLAEQRVRGIVISPVQEHSGFLRRLARDATPIVALGGSAAHGFRRAVGGDFRRDAELAVDHLLDLGHERVALVSGPPDLESSVAREQGVEAALRVRGLVPEDVLVSVRVPEFTPAAGERALGRLLEADRPPSAIFAVSDLMAIGIVHAALRAGRRVPQELAVVAAGDARIGALAAVPLTTIHYPPYAIGRAAGQLLFDGGAGPRDVKFDPELVVRESTVAGAGEA